MDKNKPTAGRTKAIHRRLELSFNLYLLLLFVGQNRASKSHLHITLRISRILQSFQQIKHLKDNSSRQNHLVIVGFLGCPYYISSPSSSHSDFIIFHIFISLTFLFIKQQQAHGKPLIVIHRRLELFFYFHLLLLLRVKTKLTKVIYIHTRIFHLLQFFNK